MMGGFNMKEAIVSEFEKPHTGLAKLEICIDKPEAPVRYSIKINGMGAIPEGEFVLIKGKKKSGKTHFIIMLTATLVFGDSFGFTGNGGKTLLFFDTEQSRSDGYSLLRLMYESAGIGYNPCERLHYYSLKSCNKDERKKYIEDAVKQYHPDVIVIDGLRDLLNDFNDITESGELMQWVKNLTDNGLTVIGVLHQNKGEQDKNSRGHLGTEAENKAASIIEVSKKDNVFTVSESDSRHAAFSDFNFSIDDNGKIHTVESVMQSSELRDNEIMDTFRKVFTGKVELPYTELIKSYAMQSGKSEKTAQRHLQKALSRDFIKVNTDKYYLPQ